MAESIACSLHMREVRGSHPAWGIHSLLPGSITHKWHHVQVYDASTLALKPMGGINQSLKQRAPVAPQNGDLSPQKIFKKKKLYH